jgi:ligand-binding sensor domain-containing protein
MNKKFQHIIILLFALFSFGQEPVIKSISEFDGLPDSEIYDIKEDKKGYIWLAANKGLYRYDGKTFLPLQHPIKRGLSVFGLQEDSNGNIWCNNISGQFFYVINNKMYLFIDLNKYIKGQLSEFKIFNKKLFALTEDGLVEVDIQTKKIKFYLDSEVNSKVFTSPFIFNNNLHFLHGKIHRKFSNGKIQSPSKVKNEFNSIVVNNHLDKNKILFFGGKDQIYLFHTNQFVSIKKPKELENISIIKFIHFNAQYWFATNTGIILCELYNNQLIYKKTLLQNTFISSIICDKNQNIWASSTQNGLFVIPNVHIKKFEFENSSNITTLSNINNNLLVYGTTDGKIGIQQNNSVTFYSLPSSKKIDKILHHKASNCLLISTEESGFLLNLNNGFCYSVSELAFAKDMCWKDSNTIIKSMYNKALEIKIPLLNSIYTTSKITKNLSVQKQKIEIIQKSIREKRSYTCLQAGNNSYIGFVDNLIINSNENILSKNKSIFTTDIENTTSSIWVSTFENGIYQIENDQITHQLSVKNGLLSNYVNKLKSRNNNLWIATDKGLQYYDVSTKKFKNILKSDGLETYDYIDLEFINNKLYLLSSKALYEINTEFAFKKIATPKVYIQKMYCNNSIVANTRNKFNYTENSFKIEFNTTGYQHEAYTNFEYRLVGLNSDWITLDKGISKLYFNQLTDGEYTFEIRIKDENNTYSKIEKINFTITPPFWKTWWFVLLVIGTLGFIGYCYFNYRIKKAQNYKRKELEAAYAEQELIFSQLENLRSQMNPHFIFNALNSIQEFIITNDKDTASEYLVKFSRLIRVYLDHSRQSEIPLIEEIKALEIYLELEKVRFEDKLNYTISVQKEINTHQIVVPSLFIQPYVENALKHGLLHKKNDRQLSLNFSINDNYLQVEIIDNGIGLTEAKKIKEARNYSHKSFALSANQKRVQLLNKTRKNKITVEIIEIFENTISKGTKVIINIPTV